MNIVSGNMFDNGFDLVVVTVNCVGVAGKGNALEWKRRDYQAYARYRYLCDNHRIQPGDIIHASPKWLLAATKGDWRNPSKPEWVLDCLAGIKAIAIGSPNITIGMPPPGAGLGGLDPQWVLAQAQSILGECANVYYHLPE